MSHLKIQPYQNSLSPLIEEPESQDFEQNNCRISIQETDSLKENSRSLYHRVLKYVDTPFVFKSVYLVSSVVSSLLVQWMYYVEIADKNDLITFVSPYLGMLLVGFLPSLGKAKKVRLLIEPQTKKQNLTLSRALGLVDLANTGLFTFGMFKISSSLYKLDTLLSVLLTAILALVFLKRKIFMLQWWGILAIIVGFSFNTIMSRLAILPDSTKQTTELPSIFTDDLFQGIALSLISALFSSAHSVLSEKFLNQEGPSIHEFCHTIGLYGAILYLFVFIIYIIPKRYQDITEILSIIFYPTSAQTKQETIIFLSKAIFGFVMLTMVYTVQIYAYFLTVEDVGAISTKIIEALRSIGIIGLSSLLYCGMDHSQCFSPEKFTSSAVVVLGVLVYFVSSK